MIQLTADGMRQIFPHAPQDIIDAFVAKQAVLDRAGVTTTRTRLSYFFSNIEHECGGFTIRNLTESTAYSPARATQVWPSRFHSISEVYAKTGSWEGDPAFATKLMDYCYGGRMGNRTGTHDGSLFIGRGGPQWTGRDGYAALASFLKLWLGLPDMTPEDAVLHAINHAEQPEVCAAFWAWKGLNPKADAGDFVGVVKIWNGGTIGLEDREHLLAGNDPAIARLPTVDRVMTVAKTLPGAPPTPAPPPEVVEAATADAKAKRKQLATAGAAVGAPGAASEGTKAAGQTTGVPTTWHLPPAVAYGLMAGGALLLVLGVVLVVKRARAVHANWF